MIRSTRLLLEGICIILLLFAFIGTVAAEEISPAAGEDSQENLLLDESTDINALKPITISGKINEELQIITDDGKVYEIVEDEIGIEVGDHVGKIIQATGTLEEIDDYNFITINSYEVKE